MENDDNNNDNYHSSNNNDNNNTLTSRFSSSSHSRAQKRPFTTNKWTSGSSFLSHDLDHNPDQVGASSDLVGAVSSSFTYRSNRFKNPLSSATRGTSSYSSYSNDSGSVYEKKEKGRCVAEFFFLLVPLFASINSSVSISLPSSRTHSTIQFFGTSKPKAKRAGG